MRSNLPTQLIIARHGETIDNKRNIFSGWRDTMLTKKGRDQCRAIGEELRGRHIDHIFCSDLPRAQQSAWIIAEHIGFKGRIEYRAEFRERHYGAWTGRSKRDLHKEFGEKFLRVRKGFDEEPPSGESLAQAGVRSLNGFEKLIRPRLNEGKVCLKVGHGGVMRAWRKTFEGLTTDEVMALEIENGEALIYNYFPNPGALILTR